MGKELTWAYSELLVTDDKVDIALFYHCKTKAADRSP